MNREDRYLSERQRETLGDIASVRSRYLRRRAREHFEAAVWIVALAVVFVTLCKWSIDFVNGLR